jgi:hypothetical protein
MILMSPAQSKAVFDDATSEGTFRRLFLSIMLNVFRAGGTNDDVLKCFGLRGLCFAIFAELCMCCCQPFCDVIVMASLRTSHVRVPRSSPSRNILFSSTVFALSLEDDCLCLAKAFDKGSLFDSLFVSGQRHRFVHC